MSAIRRDVPATLLVDSQSELGEGPIWNAQSETLHWVDITGRRLHTLHVPSNRHKVVRFEEMVCAVAFIPEQKLLVAFAKRLAIFDPLHGSIEEVCQVEPNQPENRCNDGKLDPAGRFWIGTMAQSGEKKGAGSLYRLDGNHLTRVLDNLTIPNGLGWSEDGKTMFYIDSPTREIWAFDFDPSDSSITNRRTVVRIPESLGIPDGMSVGPDGALWVANWGSGTVCEWDPRSGELLRTITTGCPLTTSCCFGAGGDLYITTARIGMDTETLAAAPNSGGLFKFNVCSAAV